ncbi:E3 SUMO-protein ligase PIAS4 [Mastomys coucha]|uniref:E3 SUMO-protein ligase PIAS4 n=1 Tax=Mastomys coucha TaxID=35658 RepID=UPI001261A496|nr:E3 SUMO-protein ligase PIAS4 [Mastomys coucha]
MAAELVEAKNMVMSFRVSDLQMLLGFVGRSKSGLKHELVTRALQLVQFDCSPELFKKIKELYETRYAKKSTEPGPQAPRPLDPLALHSMPRTPLSGPTVDYPVLYGKYLNGLGRLPTKTLKPEVRLVKLPFFNMLDELLKPTELVPQSAEKLQESPCIFALTPRQHLMYLSSATNRITVTWGNYGKSYSVALYLVRQLTSSDLLQRLKTIGVKHPELCKALVKEKLRLDPDSEIATTGVRVSLICPLVKMRLSVPCRAETCAHLQCFDAVFYLQMNEKKPTWMCPVCDKPAAYDQLIIDGLLSKILSECEDADEIEFLAEEKINTYTGRQPARHLPEQPAGRGDLGHWTAAGGCPRFPALKLSPDPRALAR